LYKLQSYKLIKQIPQMSVEIKKHKFKKYCNREMKIVHITKFYVIKIEINIKIIKSNMEIGYFNYFDKKKLKIAILEQQKFYKLLF
jgi:hypothetical protein